jgi:hypothetical protein
MYRVLKNSTAGRKGQIIEASGNRARQLQDMGIIAPVHKPDQTKVVGPTETKRGRKAKG